MICLFISFLMHTLSLVSWGFSKLPLSSMHGSCRTVHKSELLFLKSISSSFLFIYLEIACLKIRRGGIYCSPAKNLVPSSLFRILVIDSMITSVKPKPLVENSGESKRFMKKGYLYRYWFFIIKFLRNLLTCFEEIFWMVSLMSKTIAACWKYWKVQTVLLGSRRSCHDN